MLKEIYEQPEAVARDDRRARPPRQLVLEGIGLTDEEIQQPAPDRRSSRCGTVLPRRRRRPLRHRGVGAPPVRARHRERVALPQPGALEGHARRSASRSRARRADTIAAMRLAREKGARTLAITNMMGAQITREVDSVLYTRRGHRDGRRRDEDLHRAGGADLPARAQARRGQEDAPAGGDRSSSSTRSTRFPSKMQALPRRRPPDRGDRAAALRQAVLPLPRAPHRPARRASRARSS